MKHALIKTALAFIATISLGTAMSTVSVHAASATKAFSTSNPNKLTAYYSSKKAQYAFHWVTVKTNKGKVRVMVFGDFKAAKTTMVLPLTTTLSKNRKTLSSTYRIVGSNDKVGTHNYHFKVTKISSTKYQVKLATSGQRRLLSTTGTTTTFTATTKSPAKTFAAAYSESVIKTAETSELNAELEAAYKEALKKDATAKDPTTDSAMQKEVTDLVNSTTKSKLADLVSSFNM